MLDRLERKHMRKITGKEAKDIRYYPQNGLITPKNKGENDSGDVFIYTAFNAFQILLDMELIECGVSPEVSGQVIHAVGKYWEDTIHRALHRQTNLHLCTLQLTGGRLLEWVIPSTVSVEIRASNSKPLIIGKHATVTTNEEADKIKNEAKSCVRVSLYHIVERTIKKIMEC